MSEAQKKALLEAQQKAWAAGARITRLLLDADKRRAALRRQRDKARNR